MCLLSRTENESSAREFVARLRKEFPDARHHCSAFIINDQPRRYGGNPIMRSSDDGEPSGTAGTPMLDQLNGAGLSDVVAVVVRWFGGTKLGTGGLVRAYGNAVSAGVESARSAGKIVQIVTTQSWVTRVGHDIAGRLEADIRAMGIDVVDVDYGAQVTIRIASDDVSSAASLLATLTSGGSEWERTDPVCTERPVP